MKIAVVGLGYVGLPLSLQFARSCTDVIGIDVDPKKVELLNSGQSYIKHIEPSAIAELVSSGKFFASTDFSLIKDVEAVIICVPTPLTKNREPDISFVLETGRAIAPFLKSEIRNPKSEIRESRAPHANPLRDRSGQGDARRAKLVVLESTTYPGTTEEDLRAVLEEGSGSQSRRRFSFGFLARTGGS